MAYSVLPDIRKEIRQVIDPFIFRLRKGVNTLSGEVKQTRSDMVTLEQDVEADITTLSGMVEDHHHMTGSFYRDGTVPMITGETEDFPNFINSTIVVNLGELVEGNSSDALMIFPHHVNGSYCRLYIRSHVELGGGFYQPLENKIGFYPDIHFNESSNIQYGLTWAGTPYIVPSYSDFSEHSDYLHVYDTGGGSCFLYKSVTNTANLSSWARYCPGYWGLCGMQIDDGSGSNYVRACVINKGYAVNTLYVESLGGSSSIEGNPQQTHPQFDIYKLHHWTDGSSNIIYVYLVGEHGESFEIGHVTISWTPSRIGLFSIGQGAGYFDWFHTNMT